MMEKNNLFQVLHRDVLERVLRKNAIDCSCM